MYWNEEELDLIKDYPVYTDIINLKDGLIEQHKIIKEQIFDRFPEIFTEEYSTSLENFKWVMSIIWSRGHWMDEESMIPGIVPFADMMNHPTSPLKVKKWAEYFYEKKEESFQVFSKLEYEEGDQVWIDYGEKNDSEYLNYYGMAIEQNPHNFITFEISDEFLREIDIRGTKEAFMQNRRYNSRNFQIYHYFPPLELLLAIRILCLDSDIDPSKALNSDLHCNVQHEIRTYKTLIRMFGYESSNRHDIDEDTMLLEKGELNRRKRLAIQYRRAQNKLLKHFLQKLCSAEEYLMKNCERGTEAILWIENPWNSLGLKK
eukprot:TRINITY_DN6356_c0_g1_i2.p1 TRINITY_DN6356_c0_g1~~TRINITY_DN6356_c0_g1_i2.p1  ORF type:complete len:317 (-),score=53.77 TRINITY_DN6356_c0_g1_i2:36-986(-)